MPDNTITVTGHAERTAPPDIAAWRLTIAVTDAEPRVAYERCAERARGVVERLKEASEVETWQISVQPHQSYETGEARPAGHRAATVVIAQTPVERAGEIADLAIATGADDRPERSPGGRSEAARLLAPQRAVVRERDAGRALRPHRQGHRSRRLRARSVAHNEQGRRARTRGAPGPREERARRSSR